MRLEVNSAALERFSLLSRPLFFVPSPMQSTPVNAPFDEYVRHRAETYLTRVVLRVLLHVGSRILVSISL